MKKNFKFSNFKMKSLFRAAGVFFLLFAVFSGIFAGLLNQQDIRQRASEGYGNVEIVLVPSTTPLQTNNLSTVFVRLNTKGEEIDGVQVVFDLLTQVTNDVTVRVNESTGLKWAWDRVEGIQGGRKVSFAAITSDPYKPFKSNSPVDVAEITFVAKNPGPLTMVFDGFMTKANKHQQLKNVLKPIIVQEYDVKVAPSPTPTPTPKPVVSSGGNSSSGGTKGGQTTPTPSPTPSSVTANVVVNSVGGTQTIDRGQCNVACSYSSQCDSGFLCYEGKCRLSTNLTSSTCQDISTRRKICNDTCTQSSECQLGLTCYSGQCRSTTNPQSQTCQNDGTVTAGVEKMCGQTCTSNSDCGDSLSCYVGQCRLATNPTNPECNDKQVVVTNLGGSTGSPEPSPAPASSGRSLGLLTQIVIALGATVIVGFIGVVIYTLLNSRNRQRDQQL